MVKTWISNFIDTTDWGLVAVIVLCVIIVIYCLQVFFKPKDKD